MASLFSAVAAGDCEQAAALLAAGADPDATEATTDGDVLLPLELAARMGRVDLLETLLAANASPDHGDPLQHAAAHGHADTVQWLLERLPETHTHMSAEEYENAYFEEEDEPDEDREWLALCRAAAEGHCDVVEILLDACVGAGHSEEEQQGCVRWALDRAVLGGHVDVVAALLRRVPASADLRGWLISAAGAGHVVVVQMLLDAGANVDAAFRFDSPLRSAASNRRRDVVEQLLAAGADPEGGDLAGGWTPLACASGCERNSAEADPEIIDCLLLAGASPDTILRRGGEETMQEAYTVVQLRRVRLERVALRRVWAAVASRLVVLPSRVVREVGGLL